MALQLFVRNDRAMSPIIVNLPRLREDDAFSRIRCPLCSWVPSRADRWYCHCLGTPEPPFPACGSAWNTFSTRGRCPGCSHQWIWTSCFECKQWSLHEDWYEESEERG